MTLAFALIAAAALFGTVLAVLYARGPGAKPVPWPVPAAHGAIGAAGLAALILAVRQGLGPVAARFGASGFGVAAALLIAFALLLGLGIAVTRWRGKRPGGGLVGLHAVIAVAGFTLLLAIVAIL